jgi:hypothetical protein
MTNIREHGGSTIHQYWFVQVFTEQRINWLVHRPTANEQLLPTIVVHVILNLAHICLAK